MAVAREIAVKFAARNEKWLNKRLRQSSRLFTFYDWLFGPNPAGIDRISPAGGRVKFPRRGTANLPMKIAESQISENSLTFIDSQIYEN